MASFSEKLYLDEELENIENKIKEIEKAFLEDLYNLNVEDLEKVAESNGTKDIDDYILNNFKKTNYKLNTENNDLAWIYGVLTTPSLSRTQPIVSSPISSSLVSTPTSTSLVSTSTSPTSTPVSSPTSRPVSSNSSSPDKIQEGLKTVATDKVITSVVENNLQNTAKDSVNDSVSTSSIQGNIKDIATNTVKESVGQKEENTIEDQIKNSALEAVRYNIELEKEKSYAGEYPRKQVGVSNPQNACYAIASIQMLYSLPFLRKYYTELEEENFNSIKYNSERTLKLLAVDDKFNTNRINARDNLTGITIFFNLMNDATNPTLLGKCKLITNDTEKQQDVSEYLTLMRPIYIYNDVTRILSYQKLTCQNRKKVRVPEDRDEEFLSLEIPIKGNDLNSCIESFNNNNDNEYHDRCKKNDNDNKVSNAKRFYIIPPENRYLLISLKRFNNNGEKQISDVEPNKTLIIGGVKYTLSGVIVHRGITISGGHYIFIQCDKDGVFTTIYDDSTVRPFNEYKMDTLDEKNTVNISQSNENFINQNENFINQNGYIFAYTRYPVEENNPVEPKPLSVLTFPP
jgi:hypothetical protein